MADLAARFDVSNSSWTTLPERRGQARAAALNINNNSLGSAVGSRASVKCNTSSCFNLHSPGHVSFAPQPSPLQPGLSVGESGSRPLPAERRALG